MITLLVLTLILAFAPIAVWALRVSGLRRLWLLCVLALLVVVAFMLSTIYSVPTGGLLV
jgi:asparagine N-glycosylation enzyme membrane subunit Stt3